MKSSKTWEATSEDVSQFGEFKWKYSTCKICQRRKKLEKKDNIKRNKNWELLKVPCSIYFNFNFYFIASFWGAATKSIQKNNSETLHVESSIFRLLFPTFCLKFCFVGPSLDKKNAVSQGGAKTWLGVGSLILAGVSELGISHRWCHKGPCVFYHWLSENWSRRKQSEVNASNFWGLLERIDRHIRKV